MYVSVAARVSEGTPTWQGHALDPRGGLVAAGNPPRVPVLEVFLHVGGQIPRVREVGSEVVPEFIDLGSELLAEVLCKGKRRWISDSKDVKL